MAKNKTLKITLVKSPIGSSETMKKTLEALGLKKLNHSVLRPNNPETCGAVNKVCHLVKVEEL